MKRQVMSRRHLLRNGSALAGLMALSAACASTSSLAPASKPTAAPAAPPTTAPAAPAAAPAATQPVAAAPAATQPAAQAPTLAAKPAASGSLTYFNYEWEGAGVGLARRWTVPADAFEKESGVKITRKTIPSTEYWDKMLAELSTGTTTELYYGRFTAIPQYLKMDAIRPLDDVMDTKLLQDSFYPVVKESLVKDGKTVAYLCGMTSSALFYNKKLLDEAGVKVPTTYPELLDAARKLTKAPNQYGLGLTTADQVQIREPTDRFMVGFGAQWGNGKEVTANSPQALQAIGAFKELVDAGVTPANQNNPVLRPMFWEGKLAMWMDGPWFPGMAGKEIPGLAAAPIPLPSGRTTGGAQVIVMPKNAANPAAAGAYLNFISKPEWQKTMTIESGIVAGRTGIDYSDLLKQNPWYGPFMDALPKVVTNTAPGWETFEEQVAKVIRSKMAEMFARNRPVKDTLDEVQKELEQLVKENLK